MKKFQLFSILFFIVLFSLSCNMEEKNLAPSYGHVMKLSKAIDIVRTFQEYRPNLSNNDQRDGGFTVIDTLTLDDKDDLPAIYAISYIADGDTLFSLVLADENVIPIIAYGAGMFLEENIVCGVSEWINEQIAVLEYVREENLTYQGYLFDLIECSIDPDPNPCEGQSYFVEVGPLMHSIWGQGCDFNNNLGTGCTINCDHELTGCVATAMGQVMNFYDQPTTYNWTLILNDYHGNQTNAQIQEVATLMEDIGDAVSMDWGCNASSANTCGQVPGAFTGEFDYTSANSCANYQNPFYVKSDLDNDRPVIFRGVGEAGGHAWVCDGYRESRICDEIGGHVYSYMYLFFHMNWGWDGFQNGWYNYSNLNGFTSGQKYIRNIVP